MKTRRRTSVILSFLAAVFALLACTTSHFVPPDLSELKTPEDLAKASEQAYETGKREAEKKDRLDHAHAGMLYAEKCLKISTDSVPCLYFDALNTGLFIQNHIPHYQRGLKKMVSNCETVNRLQGDFQSGGCYRILGNIYSQAPSFTFTSKGITQDLDKSVEYLKKAVEVAPNYPLNQLFLARSLESMGEKQEAKSHLEEFDRLPHAGLDNEYADWNKDRDSLAHKLLGSKS